MKSLVVLRHAKSDWDTMVATDFERPLNSRGLRDAPKIGAALAKTGVIPEMVLCSPALRTRQTWDLVSSSMIEERPATEYVPHIYAAELDSLLNVLAENGGDFESLMMV